MLGLKIGIGLPQQRRHDEEAPPQGHAWLVDGKGTRLTGASGTSTQTLYVPLENRP